MPKPRKIMKLETGSVYQKRDNGVCFFRYQVNGERNALSLHTKNQEEELEKTKAFIPVVSDSSVGVVAVHGITEPGDRAPDRDECIRQAIKFAQDRFSTYLWNTWMPKCYCIFLKSN